MKVGVDSRVVKAAYRRIGTQVAPVVQKVTIDYGYRAKAVIVRNASGRPGPNTITADYVRSWDLVFGADGSVTAGTNAPQARRLEKGFTGEDSLGRCVDDQTEILTEDGWKRHDQLIEGVEVFTMNPDTWLMEWQPLQAVHRFGENEVTVIEGRSLSAAVTDDHRWLIERYYARKHEWIREWRTTADIPPAARIPLTQKSVASPLVATVSDDVVELIAWFWTEGTYCWSMQHGDSGERERTDRPIAVRISQSESRYPENVSRIRRLLHRLFGPPGPFARGAHWNERTQKHNGVVIFNIDRVGAWLMENHVSRPNKALEPQFLRQLTQSQLELLVDVSITADGCVDKNGVVRLGQMDLGRSRAWEMACALAGRATVTRTYVRPGEKTEYLTTLLAAPFSHAFGSAGRKDRSGATIRRETRSMVWCPQTANGTWLARRHGTVYVTGNSYNQKAYPHVAPAAREIGPQYRRAVTDEIRRLVKAAGR